jgi:hypothetical protein
MAIVYRVENSNHYGPYTAGGFDEDSPLYAHNYSEDHPTPLREGEPWFLIPDTLNTYRHICGFNSLVQMERWFSTTDREWLATKGFHLCSYEVPDEHCLVGVRQITFNKEHATFLGRVS